MSRLEGEDVMIGEGLEESFLMLILRGGNNQLLAKLHFYDRHISSSDGNFQALIDLDVFGAQRDTLQCALEIMEAIDSGDSEKLRKTIQAMHSTREYWSTEAKNQSFLDVFKLALGQIFMSGRHM